VEKFDDVEAPLILSNVTVLSLGKFPTDARIELDSKYQHLPHDL
jgi:hypothetical protein